MNQPDRTAAIYDALAGLQGGPHHLPPGTRQAIAEHLAQTLPAVPAVQSPAGRTTETAREHLLHALDFAYCQGIGYSTPEELLAAFEATLAKQTAPKADAKAADRAALRDRIAAVATPFFANFSDEEAAKDNAGELAVAVLAVLPEPADRAALERAADIAEDVALRLRSECLLDQMNGAYEVMAELRRLAGEQPTPERPADIQVWPLQRVLTEVRCGSEDWSWEEEWADLDRRHADTGYLAKLEQQIRENGVTMPVLIGSDGRLWDGHHRLRIAVRLGIGYVPVEITSPAGEQPTNSEAASVAVTAYSDGKGRTYCLGCAPKIGADVPLTADDVDHWELCPSCGRHVVDVTRPA